MTASIEQIARDLLIRIDQVEQSNETDAFKGVVQEKLIEEALRQACGQQPLQELVKETERLGLYPWQQPAVADGWENIKINGMSARDHIFVFTNDNKTADMIIERIKQAIAANHAQVAQGYKLVPIEPTTEMAFAGIGAASECLDENIKLMPGRDRTVLQAKHLYKAMIASVPTPPVQQPAPTGWRPLREVRKKCEVFWLWTKAFGATIAWFDGENLETQVDGGWAYHPEYLAQPIKVPAAPHPVRGGEQ